MIDGFPYRHTWLAGVVFLLVLVVGGCGDSDDSNDADTAAGSADSEIADADTSDSEADEAPDAEADDAPDDGAADAPEDVPADGESVDGEAAPTDELADEPAADEVPPPAGDEAASLSIIDFDYEPTSTTLQVGQSVRWVNDGEVPHTVTSRSADIDSGSMDAGAEFVFTATAEGDYSYFCQFHSTMQGKITVTG